MANMNKSGLYRQSNVPASYLTVGFQEETPVKPIYLELEKNLLASAQAYKDNWPEMARFCVGYAAYWKMRGEDARIAKVGFSRKQQKRMKREAARKARYESFDD